MEDNDKTREQLLNELSELRQRVAELEALECDCERTKEELEQRKEELHSLYIISAAVSQSLDLRVVLDTALKEVLSILEAPGGIVYILDESSQTYSSSVHYGISQSVIREVSGFRIGEGFSGQVAKSGEALVVPDISSDPRNISFASVRDGWRSYAGVPIKSKREVLGVMTLVSRQENYFKPEDLGLLEHIGKHIGVAVENAKNYEKIKNAESRLRQSEQRFHQMAAVIPAVFWMYTADLSELIYVSPAYGRIYEQSSECLYQKPDLWMDSIHPEDRKRVITTLERHRGEDFSIEYRILRSDSSIAWIDSNVFPIRDEFGEVQYIAGLSEDVTERKHAEEQIRLHSEELEVLVEERTSRIRELERQRAEIEKLIAAGRMSARIAHEINNPLAGIKNSFLLIKEIVPEDHPHYEFVERIENEIERMAWIVRQMFDLYRPDRDQVSQSTIDRLINDVVALLEPSCREHSVSIEIDISDVSGNVIVQDALIRQVLYNVVQNGIEASSMGDVVKISVTVAGDTLKFMISDQGVGIPEEARFRIFEPFFTTKSSQINGGLGLGLSVSKSIVEAMNGSIDFESQVGQGTTFIIKFSLEGALSAINGD